MDYLERFKCWDDSSALADRDEPKLIDAEDFREAAEEYSEMAFEEGDKFESLTVFVQGTNGRIRRFDVSVDWNPAFSAGDGVDEHGA